MASETPPEYRLIDTAAELQTLSAALEREPAVAVDLEADSMYHFREKVCLIQIAASNLSAIVDPLAIEDMSPLAPVFANPNIRKIFHGADYDIRSLYRDYRIRVQNLFDTQIACRFLGMKETGLEAVIRARFQRTLNKKYQKKDWSHRPLPREMIDYAAEDAAYLLPLALQLDDELRRLGRDQWVEEECRLLSAVRPMENGNDPLFLKFKGAGRFRPRGLAVLEALLHCRQQIAEKKDRPLFKIMGAETLLKLAKEKPLTLRRLRALEVLSEKQANMYGEALTQAVQQAMELPDEELPIYPYRKPPPMDPRVPQRVKLLKKWRDAQAKDLDMDPALVANKAQLTAIAVENPRKVGDLRRLKELRNWQIREFGKEIVAALQKGA